jgi:hypothetical protein
VFLSVCPKSNHTCTRWVLSEILRLVSTQESLGLDFWSGATRKLLIEADYSLHTGSIFGSTKSL